MGTPPALAEVLATLPALPQAHQAVERMSARYRDGIRNSQRGMQNDADRLTYITSRMPATAAAVAACLKQIDTTTIQSVLDLGSGPGSALWAIADACPQLSTVWAIERDAELIRLGQNLARHGPPILQTTHWLATDLSGPLPEHVTSQKFDLIVASYVTNELSESVRSSLIAHAWDLAQNGLLVVEPGTPAGCAKLAASREQLISLGASIAAPCPHDAACPLAGNSEQWCHFRARLSRSRAHRMAKAASRGYEDEPYAYLFAVRAKSNRKSRILSVPHSDKGQVKITLCSADGLQTKIIQRRDKLAYRTAKNLQWGDSFDLS